MLSLLSAAAMAGAPPVADLLLQADALRTSNPTQFGEIMTNLEPEVGSMSHSQQQYFLYLQGWRSAYVGDYEKAIPTLRAVADEATDTTLRFRATVTAVNVYALSSRYEDAFGLLSRALDLLPEVKDAEARQQGLGVISYLYDQVGEHDLALKYADMLIAEGTGMRGGCLGWQLKIEALYKSARLRTVGPDTQTAIDVCNAQGEATYANVIRHYMARLLVDQAKFDEALNLLRDHYTEVREAGSPRVTSGFEALMARVYRETGNPAMARQTATDAVEHAVRNQYTEPLAAAYRILYVLAKEQGDSTAALQYYEKFAAADKGYLDDVGARQLAYERVKHEALASRLQIDTLNNENQVLQLQRENNRLYIALLLMLIAFIAFWAYKTKRSQLHFMKLSQQDGLTGIANRPHFIAMAERALDSSRKTRQEVCVVLCDLDYFKAINDQFGHAAGDAALKAVVATCRTQLRLNDVFGRVGGEEFGVLLPGCSLEAAQERCEQLRRALETLQIDYEGRSIGLTGSFGVESTASGGYDLRQLLANADAALYHAKDTGRNRIVLYDPSLGNVFSSEIQTGRFRARERFGQDFAAQRG